nr:glycosyltransferase [Tumebacillus amylolyticus]
MFFDSNEVLLHLLPNGFYDGGHDIMVVPAESEERVRQVISGFQPDVVLTYGWGNEQLPEKLCWIRACTREVGIPHVYWSVEDPTFLDNFVKPVVLTHGQPDFVFTICEESVQEYAKLGIPAAPLDWGFQPSIHRPLPPISKYDVSIAVVANSYHWVLGQYDIDYRMESMRVLIQPLLEQGIRIDFWGKGWEGMKPFLGQDIPADWLHGQLSYLECNKVYSSAKIVIGLQNFLTQMTQRTYEILGSGGFLITSDTPAVRKVFTPWRDLVVSSTPEETLFLVDYYLRHPQHRDTIRTQGQMAVQKNHSYRERADYILRVLREKGILKQEGTV